MRILAWNLEWATQRSQVKKLSVDHIDQLNPDIALLSEVKETFLPSGNVLLGGEDWGYKSQQGRRKVAIVSSNARYDDVVENMQRPLKGRYISTTISVYDKEYRVISVCIPWKFCHTNTGAKDQKVYGEHLAFIGAMNDRLDAEVKHELPIILGGDFNQPIGIGASCNPASKALNDLLNTYGLIVATANQVVPDSSKKLLNHIALRGAQPQSVVVWNNMINGNKVTDHAGAMVCV